MQVDVPLREEDEGWVQAGVDDACLDFGVVGVVVEVVAEMVGVDEADEDLEELHHHPVSQNLDDLGVQESARGHILLQLQFVHFFLLNTSQVEAVGFLSRQLHLHQMFRVIHIGNSHDDLLPLTQFLEHGVVEARLGQEEFVLGALVDDEMAAQLLFRLNLSGEDLAHPEALGVQIQELADRQLQVVITDALDNRAHYEVSCFLVGFDS